MGLGDFIKRRKGAIAGGLLGGLPLVTTYAGAKAAGEEDALKNVARDTPFVGDILDLKSSAEIAADEYGRASDAAGGRLSGAYQASREMYDPFYQVGLSGLDRLKEGYESGAYTPSQFQYSGTPQASQRMGTLDKLGIGGLGRFQNYKADPMQSPEYQYRLGQGQKAIQRAAAARGALGAGSTDLDLMSHAQGMASEAFGRDYDRQRALEGDIYNRMMGLEGQQYQRGTYADELARRAEQEEYQRALTGYGLGESGKQQQYGMMRDWAGMGSDAAGALAALQTGEAQSIADLLLGKSEAQGAARMADAQARQQLLMEAGGLLAGKVFPGKAAVGKTAMRAS